MAKSISATQARGLHKTLQDVLDEYEKKPGTRPKQQLQAYEEAMKAVAKKIDDLTA